MNQDHFVTSHWKDIVINCIKIPLLCYWRMLCSCNKTDTVIFVQKGDVFRKKKKKKKHRLFEQKINLLTH